MESQFIYSTIKTNNETANGIIFTLSLMCLPYGVMIQERECSKKQIILIQSFEVIQPSLGQIISDEHRLLTVGDDSVKTL